MRWSDEKPEWRRWFAWYPVRIGTTHVWLETIERKEMGEYMALRFIAEPFDGMP